MALTRRALGASALAGAAMAAARPASATSPAQPETGDFGLDLASVDRSVAPGDDFYRYVNGGWLKTAQIPADRARWQEFYRLDELNAVRSRGLLEACAAGAGDRQLGDFYISLMDAATLQSRGTAPLTPQLEAIARLQGPADIARAIVEVSRSWLRPLPGGASPLPPSPIITAVGPDPKQPTRYLPQLNQGGLGMPDRDYYLLDDASFAKTRAAYRLHLATMFRLAGWPDPDGAAARVYALEERLARSHWTRAAQRNPEKLYNIWNQGDFAAKAPGLDWDAFLAAAGFADQPIFHVAIPDAVAGVAAAARDVPIADWRDYFAFRAIKVFAPVGPKAFVDANFEFQERTLAGTPELPADWKRAVQLTERGMGHALSALYVAKYFPPAARQQAQVMTQAIKAAMGRRITALAWMTPQTKARALKKLAAARIEVGAQTPEQTYGGLIVRRDDAYGNLRRAAAYAYEQRLKKLGKPVDRGEWTMLAETVNAQANPVLLKIMFPAGIMQGLFFDPHADAAVNYGAIGVVMGHELSHLFDDQGARFDEKGALNNWWTPEDLKQFTAATEALAAQYDSYAPLPGAHINGHLTLGENIADLAGLALARDAYHASLGGRPAPVLAGLTGDQRFFMSFAQLYRGLQRDSFLRQMLATDPHSPGEWRAAEVRNIDAWYDSFGVKPGQKMYLAPEQRVRMW